MRKRLTKPLPSINGKTGRDPSGKFAVGNRLGRGGAPLAARGLQLRAALFAAVTPDDIAAIVRQLVKRAKRGDVKAAREVLNRLTGKPVPTDQREPLQILIAAEQIIAERMTTSRRLSLAHARGEALDIEPSDDPRISTRDQVDADPPHERRRVLKEMAEQFNGA